MVCWKRFSEHKFIFSQFWNFTMSIFLHICFGECSFSAIRIFSLFPKSLKGQYAEHKIDAILVANSEPFRVFV